MDLVSSVVNLKQAEVASRVQFAVAAKVLDSQKQVGASVVNLINAAAQGPARAGDQLTAAALGLGGSLDTYA
jgi:hypothetical protein